MWASWIMPTSFAPSPIAKVTGLVVSFLLTNPTINRFCAGDTRHATTALQTFANFKKRCSSSSFPRIVSMAVAPSTTKAKWSDANEAGVRWGSSSNGSRSVDSCSDDLAETAAGSGVAALCTTASSAVSCAPRPQSPSGPFVAPSAGSFTRNMSSVNNLADLAMLIAVSTLSPVSTQSLISALANSWIVSGTPSWSRSSMAVAPTISKSRSISAAASANLPFRSSVAVSAARQALRNLSFSDRETSRRPSTSVLKPTRENCCKQSSSAGRPPAKRLNESLPVKPNMMLSAPLHRILALPSGPWTNADMRFRVELKGIVANTK
mmetsp:Transcript_26498/g.68827  ORF Transcript_26498/g.68827 Transcript_26498/m.68827 type:complete len:322 (+) Transcript_26498:1185-2150(+)